MKSIKPYAIYLTLFVILLTAAVFSVPLYAEARDKWDMLGDMEAAEEPVITVVADGREIVWYAAAPRFSKGQVMAAADQLGQALGAETVWQPSSQDVYMYLYDRYVWMQASNRTLYYGNFAKDEQGRPVLTGVNVMPIDPPADLTDGYITVPLAPLIEALGGQLRWEEESLTAYVTGPEYAPAQFYENTLADAKEPFERDRPQEESEEAVPGYFQIISADTAMGKYEDGDPMLLVCYDVSQPEELREVLRAAADTQMKVYGLDMGEAFNQRPPLPFLSEQSEARPVVFYVIEGNGQIEALSMPSANEIIRAMEAYGNK